MAELSLRNKWYEETIINLAVKVREPEKKAWKS